MDALIWILIGVGVILLATVVGLIITTGDQRDKLQQARADLGVVQSARSDYQQRLRAAEDERNRTRAQVDQLNARLGILAEDQEYMKYLKTTHQVLNDFRDWSQMDRELTALRARTDAQRKELEARGVIYQDFASLDEARRRLDKEKQDFETTQRTRRAEQEQKLAELDKANKAQIDALKQAHNAELQILKERLEARRAALGPKTAEIDKAEQELKKRADLVKQESVALENSRGQLSQQNQNLVSTRDRLAAELAATRDAFAKLGYLLEGDGLVCSVDWRTYKPDEVRYVPRMTVRPILAKDDKKRNFTRPQAIELTATPVWREWIARERAELKTPEQQLSALFEAKCPNDHPNEPVSLWPRSTHWVVPIIGGTSSGKTLYVTTLINELRGLLPRGYAFECEPADTESYKNYTDLRKMIFEDRVIRPTQSKRDMIYGIGPLDKANPRRLTVFFRDIAGEYWQQGLHSTPDEHGPFLLAAPCIMVLVDPLADPQLRNIIRDDVQKRKEPFGNFSTLPTPEEIMTSVTLFLRKHGGYENTIIPKDLLMVLTKADLLDGIVFSKDDPVREPIKPGRPFASHRINQISDSIVMKLRQHNALRAVVDSLPGQYKSVRWFAASALGYSLEESYQRRAAGQEPSTLKHEPKPIHVTDPILHCMWLSGLLS